MSNLSELTYWGVRIFAALAPIVIDRLNLLSQKLSAHPEWSHRPSATLNDELAPAHALPLRA